MRAFRLDETGEFVGSIADGLRSERGGQEFSLRRALDDLRDLGGQARGYVARRFAGSEQPEPAAIRYVVALFLVGLDVGKLRVACFGADRKALQLAAPYEGTHDLRRARCELDFSGDRCLHRGPGALVRHMHDLHAGTLVDELEQLVRSAAHAERAEVQLAWILLG